MPGLTHRQLSDTPSIGAMRTERQRQSVIGLANHGMPRGSTRPYATSFVREPEGNDCIERSVSTPKEPLLWEPHFQDLGRTPSRPSGIPRSGQPRGLVERLGIQSPRQARQRFLALQQTASLW